MSPFIGSIVPEIRVVGDRVYELTAPYVVEWQVNGLRRRLKIAEGFRSDGNSVPWFARAWIPGDWSLGIVPVLAHDYLYDHEGRTLPGHYWAEVAPGAWQNPTLVRAEPGQDAGKKTVVLQPWTRRDVDRLFARLMRDEGVVMWRRRMAYRAVRCAVWHAWDERPYHLETV
jgi:hypothetical protein